MIFKKLHHFLLLASLVFTAEVHSIVADNDKSQADCNNVRQFTFSWQFIDHCNMKPRGGTSTGAHLLLNSSPHPGWLKIQEAGISDFERDRRAILAMIGPYRTSFDFLEIVGYTSAFTPGRPYQSWGTEYVYLVEDRDDFISLQHLMVMFYEDDKGEIQGPIVQKHWRQDWQYEKRDIFVYAGHDQWQHKKYPRSEAKGTWAQSVFQVDDSPRYEAIGSWDHEGNLSTWLSDKTWRPLPRRESSVRDDYQVLVGTNRHTITPTGWVQEEENYKTILDAKGNKIKGQPYIAKELGVARYERLKDFDFSAGDDYWRNTSSYWKDVRDHWEDLIKSSTSITLKDSVNGQPLFMPFFMKAEEVNQKNDYDSEDTKVFIQQTLEKFTELN